MRSRARQYNVSCILRQEYSILAYPERATGFRILLLYRIVCRMNKEPFKYAISFCLLCNAILAIIRFLSIIKRAHFVLWPSFVCQAELGGSAIETIYMHFLFRVIEDRSNREITKDVQTANRIQRSQGRAMRNFRN